MIPHATTIRLLLALLLCLGAAATPAHARQNDTPENTRQDDRENARAPADAAHAPRPVVAPEFESPRATMSTFLVAMDRYQEASVVKLRERADAMANAIACLDMSGRPQEAGSEDAIHLLAVLNRIGVIEPWMLPDRRHVDEQALERFVFFPQDLPAHSAVREAAPWGRIELARQDSGHWKFSSETVAGIFELHRAVESLPIVTGVHESRLSLTMRMRQFIPAPLRQGQTLGVEHWKWLGLLILVLLAVTLDYTVRALLTSVTTKKIVRRGGEPNPETIKRTVRPFGLFTAALFFLAGVNLIGLPAAALNIVLPAVRLFLMLAGVWAGFRVADLISEVFAKKAARTRTKFDDLLIPLLRRAAKIFIFIFGLIYIANSLEIEILPLLTGLGIGGLAFAFAAKDTIENFFGSVAVLVDRPFEVGDWVKIGETEGIVEELGFRSTRIRTFYNSQVTMPNATLVRATVDNYGRRRFRRIFQKLGIAYNTPPDKIEAFCEGIRELVRSHPFTRKDFYAVNFNEFGNDSLNVMVYVFHETPDWATELRERQRFFLDILRLADGLGVEFAFPTQTLYLRREEWPPGEHRPSEPPDSETESRASVLGRETAAMVTGDAPWRQERPGPVSFASPPTPPKPKKKTTDPTQTGESDL